MSYPISHYNMEYEMRERIKQYQEQARRDARAKSIKNRQSGIRHSIGQIMISIGQKMAGETAKQPSRVG